MPTPSRILIAGKIRSTTNDGNNTTLSNNAQHHTEHLAFRFPSTVAKLANCLEKTNVPIEVGDLNECRTKAADYIAGELPASWSIDQTDRILGHAWRDGAWVPTGGGLAYQPHAFRLHFPIPATPYVDFSSAFDPANPARSQRVTFEYFVVVQPMVIP